LSFASASNCFPSCTFSSHFPSSVLDLILSPHFAKRNLSVSFTSLTSGFNPWLQTYFTLNIHTSPICSASDIQAGYYSSFGVVEAGSQLATGL